MVTFATGEEIQPLHNAVHGMLCCLACTECWMGVASHRHKTPVEPKVVIALGIIEF